MGNNNLSVVEAPLPFKVFIKTSNGELTSKAAFATDGLAGGWAIGVLSQGAELRIFEDRDGKLHDITEDALQKTIEALKADPQVQAMLKSMIPAR